ncbi:MAG: gas vesicle protein [Candidatus Omnitrophica bacterium]|nr:gas vesicle protein [Candidatus Omnitrophota bacterium]
MAEQEVIHALQPAGLADILERVLDKGVVIVGDIKVKLVDVELLTIKIRLLISSVERAKEIGIDWWTSDFELSSKAKQLHEENRLLRDRLDRIEAALKSTERRKGG